MQKEFRATEDLLQIQLNRFQALPKAQKLANLEAEQSRLENLIKVLTMKEDNAAQRITRPDSDSAAAAAATETFQEFCVAL